MSSCKAVDEAGAVALSQDMEDAGLVEVGQVNQVLYSVLMCRAGLKIGRERERDSMTIT